MLSAVDFYNTFPELAEINSSLIEVVLIRTAVTTNSYAGLATIEAQNLAVLLHSAHNLVKIQKLEGAPSLASIPPFKKIENKNDKIEFQTIATSAYDLETTSYGRELLDLIECNSRKFFVHDPVKTFLC